MPSSPLAPGSCTLATFSRSNWRCGVTMMSSMASGSMLIFYFSLLNSRFNFPAKINLLIPVLRAGLHRFSLLQGFFDGAHHVKGLLGNIVIFAFDDFLEAAHGVFDLHVFAFEAGELRGDEHRLRQELFDLAGAGHRALVVVGKLFDTENGDDVLQILVALQNGFYAARDGVVFLSDDARIENARKAGQRIDRG